MIAAAATSLPAAVKSHQSLKGDKVGRGGTGGRKREEGFLGIGAKPLSEWCFPKK